MLVPADNRKWQRTVQHGDYIFDNARPETKARFSGLEAVCDPVTHRQLTAVGVGRGWRCLEIGTGAGSIAHWLCEQVGPAGSVLAVDLDVRWFATPVPANVEVRQLDLRTAELPEATFDLIHGRLVLQHIPNRSEVLTRLVASLKPGGWLVASEFDNLTDACPEPVTEVEVVINRVHAAYRPLLASRGADTAYGRRLHHAFAAQGLVEVHTDGHLEVGTGGSAAADILRANLLQSGRDLIKGGWLTERDIVAYVEALDDPHMTWLMPVLFTARGRRPSSDPAD